MATGVGGVDSSNNIGIWVVTSQEDLRLMVRTGQVIGGKVLTDLPLSGFSAGGHPLEMDENSLLWRGGFGADKAIVVSRLGGDNSNEKD